MKDEALRMAMRKAFNLGSVYWQQVDSEFSSNWKKGDATKAQLDQLIEDTIKRAIAESALDKKAENARELGLDYEPAQQKPVCQWQREDDDHMPDTWRSDCGVLWTFTDGGPVDNDMKYCCGCGAKLKEKNT
jgi:hypothetical protein